MLGIGGRFAALKGMVRVPNLAGLSRSAAQTAIESAGLIYGGSSDTTINDISLDDKIANQSIIANTLVDYETSVSVTRYRYEASGGTPSYPPKPSDDGQIIPGDCVISGGEISYPTDEAYCDGTTRVQPTYQVYRRVDKKVTYTEGPSYTWIRSEVNQPSVICDSVFSSNFNTYNSSLCVSCTTVVSSTTYSGANSACSTGYSNYRTDIYPDGCTPANKTVALGCISDPNPPAVTLEYTLFGDCTQATPETLSTGNVPCYYDGGGIQTRTRHYSDNTDVVDNICCTYTPPAPVCTPTTSTGAWSSCNAVGINPGTRSRTVTTTFDDCSQTTVTETETCYNAGCGPYGEWSPACTGPGVQQTRSATCIDSAGNDYPDTQTQCCTGMVVSYGPCTGGIVKRRSKSTTTYYSNCTSNTVTTTEECNLFE